MHKERDDMSQILKKRITVDSHKGDHRQREQGHRHNNDPDRGRHRNPHQLRIAYQNHKENSFDGIACLHHAAEEFTGIRVIGRDRVNVAVFLFFHAYLLQAVVRNLRDIQYVVYGDECLRGILGTNHENTAGQGLHEPVDQIAGHFIIFLYTFCNADHLTVHKMDPILIYKHYFHLPSKNCSLCFYRRYLYLFAPLSMYRTLRLGT